MRKILVFILFVMTTIIYAQNFNNGPVNMIITGTVGQVQRITLPGDQAFNLTGDSANGTVGLGTVNIFSNVNYALTVSTDNTFTLNSTTTGGAVPYSLKIGTTTVSTDNSTIATGARVVGTGEDLALELEYDLNTAEALEPASDYIDTLTFTIASP